MMNTDGAQWDTIESGFYEYLTRHARIEGVAQRRIFTRYAEQFRAGQRVLDVGAGQGEFLDLLRARAVEAVGLDADAGMIAEIRRREHDIFEGDAIVFLHETDERFDGVFMGNFIEHFAPQDALALIAGAFRVLRPGGLLVLATPDPRSLHVHLQEYWRDATHVRLYDRDLLAYLVETSGFRVIETGSNDATAFDPGSEWFGDDFAARLAALDAGQGTDEDTGEGEGGMASVSQESFITPPTGGISAIRASPVDSSGEQTGGHPCISAATAPMPIPLSVPTLSDLTARLDALAASVDAGRREATTAVAAVRDELRGLETGLAVPAPRPAPPPLGDETSPSATNGASPHGLPALLPERRSVVALRQWQADAAPAWEPSLPRPSIPVHLDGIAGDTPAIFDLMANIFTEVRHTAEVAAMHTAAIKRSETRLDALGAILAQTQREMMQATRAVRDRIEVVQARMMKEIAIQEGATRQLAGEFDAVWGTFAELQRSRAAAAEQTAAQFDQLYAARAAAAEQTAAQFDQLYAARATAAEQTAAQFADVRRAIQDIAMSSAAEPLRRAVSVETFRRQLLSFLSHLYPPREYFVVAQRAVLIPAEDASLSYRGN